MPCRIRARRYIYNDFYSMLLPPSWGPPKCHATFYLVILPGKTISRAVCGHMLINAALTAIVVTKAYHILLPIRVGPTYYPKRRTAIIDSEIDDDVTASMI